MLSIGKLAAGQAKYYLDQADARVDVVQSVGGGVEDYYLAPHEARGRWIGSAGHEIGLQGDVGADALRRVLAGGHPEDGGELRVVRRTDDGIVLQGAKRHVLGAAIVHELCVVPSGAVA